MNRKSEIGIGHLSAGQKRTAAATHNLVGRFSKWKVNTMTNISNKLAPAQVVAKLNGLATDRATWENGAFKQSNDELYALLNRCFTLMEQMKGNTKLIKELNALLGAKKIVFNDGTSLATKIARFVFNGNNKRITGYARVLRVAGEEKAEKESFAKFIQRKGGVEEVRKQNAAGTLTQAEQAKQNVRTADCYFAKSRALTADISCSEATMHPDQGAEHGYTAALVRKNKNGTLSIVFGCNKASVVKVLLAEGGKFANKQIAAVTNAASRANTRKVRTQSVKQAAATVLGQKRSVNLKIAA